MYTNFFKKFFLISLLIWCAIGLALWQHSSLLSLIGIAFLLGLRHGFDVDHIVMINNATSHLALKKQQHLSTGLCFSLGHSSVVLLLTLCIVFSAELAKTATYHLAATGAYLGSGISIFFLLITGFSNLALLSKLFRRDKTASLQQLQSPLAKLIRPVTKTLDRPYKLLLVGFLFGLGFDTASEISLLGLAAASSLKGLSIWLVLCLPIAFASGMTLVDSLDAALMSKVNALSTERYQSIGMLIIALIASTSLLIALFEAISLWQQHTGFKLITMIQYLMNQDTETLGVLIVGLLGLLFVVLLLMKYWAKNTKPKHLACLRRSSS